MRMLIALMLAAALAGCAGNPLAEKIAVRAEDDAAAATARAAAIGDQAAMQCYPAFAPLLPPAAGPLDEFERFRGAQMAALGPCAPISAQALLQLLMQLGGLAKAAAGIP